MSFRTNRFGDAEVVPFPRRTPNVAASETRLPVLMILHQESSTPGRVGNALRALGHRLDIRRPRFGDPLPETLDQHAAPWSSAAR
jgi:GMP synthase (glutamine-hydrolysing)